MTKASSPSAPVIRSVEVPNGHRMVIVRRDAFQTAVSVSSAPQVSVRSDSPHGRSTAGQVPRKGS